MSKTSVEIHENVADKKVFKTTSFPVTEGVRQPTLMSLMQLNLNYGLQAIVTYL